MAAFDEMGIAGGPTRPLYHQVARWLSETPPELLASRRVQAEFMFRRIGITFGVYGDKDAAERLIPFDIVPRLISRAERPGSRPASRSGRARSTSSSRTSTGRAPF